MTKKALDMVAINTPKANAQNLTCFIAFVAACALSIVFMLVACIMPALVNVTKIICWVSMALEAMSAGLGWVAYWIKRNALQ